MIMMGLKSHLFKLNRHFSYLVFIMFLIPGHAGGQRTDNDMKYACAFSGSWWVIPNCQNLVLTCPRGKLITISGGRYGSSYGFNSFCNRYSYFSADCSLGYGCCSERKLDFKVSITQGHKNELSVSCNGKARCNADSHLPQTFQGQYQYVLVAYLCRPETTTSRATLTPNHTNVTISGSKLSAINTSTWADRGTSTVIHVHNLLCSSTKQNTLSAKTKKYIDNLPEQASVPMVAVILPSVLIPISVGIGIFIFCRKRCKVKERSITVDSTFDISQRNPIHANNNYESKSYVVETHSEPNDIVRCNEQTPSRLEDVKTNDVYSSDMSSHTYVNLEVQDQYTSNDPKQVLTQAPEEKFEATALDDDYNRIRFTQNSVRNDQNYDTMDKLQYVGGIEEKGEYSNINDSQRKLSNDIDYSHINLHERDDLVGEVGETYSHLHGSDDKRSFENVINNVEYSHLNEM